MNRANTAIVVGVFAILLVACSSKNLHVSLDKKNQGTGEQQSEVSNASTYQLETLAAKIDARIGNMKILAKTIANDKHIHAWIKQGASSQGEAILIEKLGFLVEEYQLTSASFADKSTNKYWNHEGFLRVLDPAIDTWYFAYTATREQNLISVYHDKNKHRVDLYVNYQQLPGEGTSFGLSGIATSFDGVLDMMLQSKLSERGLIMIADANGIVQVHPNMDVAGVKKLAELIGEETSKTMLKPANKQSTQGLTHLTTHSSQTKNIVSVYMPNMDSYLILLRD